MDPPSFTNYTTAMVEPQTTQQRITALHVEAAAIIALQLYSALTAVRALLAALGKW